MSPAWPLWLSAALLHAGVAAAAPAARDSLRAAPVEVRLPADIVYGRVVGSERAVVFSHASHVALANDRCTGCHPQPFHMLTRGPAPRHRDMDAGGSCGICHDGKRAFGLRDSATCSACHAGEPSRRAAPAGKGGPALDAAARRVPGPHAFPRGGDSPGPVTFRHDRHLRGAAGCATCHPKPFRMAAAPPLPGGGMHERAACGACHDGRKAFAAEDTEACARCHVEPGARP